MEGARSHEVTVAEEIARVFVKRPHVVLLGAGASKAALPNGDKSGVLLPLLPDLAATLNLAEQFPDDLRSLAETDFEAAYSRLFDRGSDLVTAINAEVVDYFSKLQLPEEANLYDALNLSLREKDVIFTFNWDPFLLQSQLRLRRLGVRSLPMPFFLHGNVMVGFCRADRASGYLGGTCRSCGNPLEASPLLFPVEKKNYQDGGLIEREWKAVQAALKGCFMLTAFGYSAPTTDVEAIDLLKQGWGKPAERNMEQTEIINRPGSDHDALRKTWDPFIHSHHYEVHESFYESWLGRHPRRSGEAYWNQYWEAKFIDDNSIPSEIDDLGSLVAWFQPLFAAEATADAS